MKALRILKSIWRRFGCPTPPFESARLLGFLARPSRREWRGGRDRWLAVGWSATREGWPQAPRLRQKGDPPPVYGVNGQEFTVEVHHGGFLVGSGHAKSYVHEKVSWFDHCEVETWSALWFDDIAEQLGYTKSATFEVYWLLPGKTLVDGLRIISTDSDTNAMCSVVHRVQNLVLYFHHLDILVKGERLPEFYEGLPNLNNLQSKFGEGSKEDSEGSEFVDSEYEVEEGDGDLPEGILEEEQDKQLKFSKSKKARGSRLKSDRTLALHQDVEELSSEEDLELPAEETKSEVNMKFSTFRAEDMNNPTFKVGMVFDCVETLRAAITEYSLKQRVEIKFARNEKERFRAHCNEGFPWNLYASKDERVKAFVVKTYSGSHNCQKEWNLKRCTANWLAEKYVESFRANDKMSIANFSRIVQKEWNLTPSRTKLARAAQSSQFASQENPHTDQYFSQALQPMGMMAHLSSTMLLQMLEQGSKTPAYFAQTPAPLPEPAFISSNTTMPRPAVLTTATKEGKAATRKRKPANKKEAPGNKKADLVK